MGIDQPAALVNSGLVLDDAQLIFTLRRGKIRSERSPKGLHYEARDRQ